MDHLFVGLDVAKDHLNVHVRKYRADDEPVKGVL